jgi:hypothetical protein
MTEPRMDPEELGRLAELPADDPRVQALGPRDRARLRAFLEFANPEDVPEGARVAEAEARLGEALGRELGLSGTPVTRPADAPPHGAGPGIGGRIRALFAPSLRPALAVAVAIVVAGGVWRVIATRPDDPRMRGPQAEVPGVGLSASARPLANGVVRLEWSASREARAYTVVFLSPSLAELARLDGLTEAHLDLVPGALPPGLEPSQPVLWRVVARSGADEVSSSQTLPLTLPK